ncbi:MAG: SDR family oxidoreductase [Chloroflexi bacterium]|nr:SDR family oxidoreductase [Chloroflexota bacterium]
METGLRGKVVLITGAGGGIGRACAIEFGQEGARLVLSDVNLTAAQAVADEQVAQGVEAIAVQTEVTSAESVQEMINRTLSAFGQLDVLINNAGIFQSKPILEMTAADWDRVLEVNLRGVFLCGQAAFRVMMEQRSGKIVSLGSLAGQVGGIVAGANYAASKAGVICFTKSLAKQAGPYNINVNCVNPGVIDTAMTQPWGEERRSRMAADTPLRRLGTAAEVAKVIVFLASDAASFVHGAHVDINGGINMD